MSQAGLRAAAVDELGVVRGDWNEHRRAQLDSGAARRVRRRGAYPPVGSGRGPRVGSCGRLSAANAAQAPFASPSTVLQAARSDRGLRQRLITTGYHTQVRMASSESMASRLVWAVRTKAADQKRYPPKHQQGVSNATDSIQCACGCSGDCRRGSGRSGSPTRLCPGVAGRTRGQHGQVQRQVLRQDLGVCLGLVDQDLIRERIRQRHGQLDQTVGQ